MNGVGKIEIIPVFDEGNNHHDHEADQEPGKLFEVEGCARGLAIGGDAVEIQDSDGSNDDYDRQQGPIEMDE
jgi:hypothetical protein